LRILIVEDELAKLEDLQDFFSSRHSEYAIDTARSVRSAVDALRHEEVFSLIVLDMSLPTFDITLTETGGAPKGFGGLEVLRYMQKSEITSPVVVVTAFEAFSQGDRIINLDDMRASLLEEFPEMFYGAVYYNVVYNSWLDELQSIVANVGLGKK